MFHPHAASDPDSGAVCNVQCAGVCGLMREYADEKAGIGASAVCAGDLPCAKIKEDRKPVAHHRRDLRTQD